MERTMNASISSWVSGVSGSWCMLSVLWSTTGAACTSVVAAARWLSMARSRRPTAQRIIDRARPREPGLSLTSEWLQRLCAPSFLRLLSQGGVGT